MEGCERVRSREGGRAEGAGWTELFEALQTGLRSKRNSIRFAIPEKRIPSLPALSAFFAAYSIAAAFLLATDDGAGAGRRDDGRAVAQRSRCRDGARAVRRPRARRRPPPPPTHIRISRRRDPVAALEARKSSSWRMVGWQWRRSSGRRRRRGLQPRRRKRRRRRRW